MTSYIDNDELLIHCFQDSLSWVSLDLYMNLELGKISSWKDSSDAFLNQYKYNIDMTPTRLHHQNKAQRSNETFKEYAQRWREMASRVMPTLTDTEFVDIFTGTLQGWYYEKMVGSLSSNFIDLFITSERIESVIKTWKITDGGNQQAVVRRPSSGYAKKKEGETNVVTTSVPQYQAPMVPPPYYPYPYVVATQVQQPFQYQP